MTSTHAGPAFSTWPGPKQDPDQGSGLAKVTAGKFRDFIWADWIMFAMVCSIMVSLTVVRSRTHLLWADELFTRSMITPPSVKTTLLGSYKGADGGGVLFYLLARGWYLIFGDSALALRLFSTLGMCSALLFTWAGARRYFAPLPVGLAVALIYLSTPVLLWQNDNARFYGLFLASAALASYLFLKSAEQPLTRLELVALAAAHSGLIGSHILGIAYSFALITGMVLLDLSSQRLRPSLYGAALIGWLVFFVTLPAVHASAKVGANHFWTVRPDINALLKGTTLEGRFPSWALLVVLLCAGVSLARRHQLGILFSSWHRARAPFALCLCLLSVQLLLFLKSQFGISVYVDRYLMPLSIVAVLLFSAGFTVLLPEKPQHPPFLLGPLTLAFCLVPLSVFAFDHDIYATSYATRSYVDSVVTRLPADQPVLASIPEYNLFSTYDRRHRYFYMLNWPYDLAPSRGDINLAGEHLMQNWRRAGLDPGHILNCPEIFDATPKITVLVDFVLEPWFQTRLAHNTGFVVRDLGPATDWGIQFEIYAVQRIAPDATPCEAKAAYTHAPL